MELRHTNYQDLPVTLSEEDKTEKRREVLRLLDEKESLEFRLKQAKDSLGGDIKDKGNKIDEVRRLITAGKENKRVATEVIRDLVKMRYTIRRLDNGDVLEDRILRSDEIPTLPPPPKPKQAELPLEKQEGAPEPDSSCAEPVYGPEDEPEFISKEIEAISTQRRELIATLDKGQPTQEQQADLSKLEREIDKKYMSLLAAMKRVEDKKAKEEENAAKKGASGSPESGAGENTAPGDDPSLTGFQIVGGEGQPPAPKTINLEEAEYPGFITHAITHFGSAARLAAEVDTRLEAQKRPGLNLSARSYQRYSKGERKPEKAIIEQVLSVLPKEVIRTFHASPQAPVSPQSASKSPAKKGKKS